MANSALAVGVYLPIPCSSFLRTYSTKFINPLLYADKIVCGAAL